MDKINKNAGLVLNDKGNIKKGNKKYIVSLAVAILLVGLGMATVGLIQTHSARADVPVSPSY